MRRNAVRVRPAEPSDVPAVVDLLVTLRESGATESQRATLMQTLDGVLADPDRLLLVAVLADAECPTVVGTGLLQRASASMLLDLPAAMLSHSVVAERSRRRGVGRALVAAATAWAEEQDLDRVMVSVPPGSREVNRFFARLGFAPVVTRRVVGTAALRRRLGAGDMHAHAEVHLPASRRRAMGARRGEIGALGARREIGSPRALCPSEPKPAAVAAGEQTPA